MSLRKTLGDALSCVLIWSFIRKTLGYDLSCVLIRFIEIWLIELL